MADTAMPADLGNVGLGTHGLAVETVASADGTPIAFERSGEGPAVVIMGGGLNDRAMFRKLASLLAANFTVFNYDRRGRGDSGDTELDKYSIKLEMEDLDAVVRATGERCALFANCSGGQLAVPATAYGLPIRKLAVYEPPYAAPPIPTDLLARLRVAILEGRRADAVELFQRESVRFDEETIARFRKHPIWPTFEALAPTIWYDSVLGEDQRRVPMELLAKITVPTLVMDGGASPDWMHLACEKLARGIPGARHHRVADEGHLFNQDSGAPLLADFFGAAA